jgi:hypothetical protein
MSGPLLAKLIETDPILRLHCAVARDGVPYPGHPVHGKATRVVDLDDIQDGADELPTSLARVFRICVDRYGIGIGNPRFEVAPGGRATGRVVLPDVAMEELDEESARRGLAELTETIALLGRTTGIPTQLVLATELRFLSARAAALLEASGDGRLTQWTSVSTPY